MTVEVSEMTLDDARAVLHQLETANELPSKDFYARYLTGEFIGSQAAMRWSTYYEFYLNLEADAPVVDRSELLLTV